MISEIGLPEPLGSAVGWIGLGGVLLALLAVRAALRARRATAPMARHLAELDGAVRALNDGQNQLHGGITQVAEINAAAQARLGETLERRFADLGRSLDAALGQSSTRTARSLGALQERLSAIDRAQSNIEKLSGDVLGLQDILSNKQARGAFGEIQLQEIVTRALPPDAARFQATLGNGMRADCLIDLPRPPGPIVIDAKFPLEPYEALRAAATPEAATSAKRAFRTAVRAHLRAISEKYILDGETADSALMFLPSEAIYAELHSNFGDVVREGFGLRVWTVSPSTCMATLHTLRAVLRDVRLREQAHAARRELALLFRDAELLCERTENLDRHLDRARNEISGVRAAAERAKRRSHRLEDVNFDPESDPGSSSNPENGGPQSPTGIRDVASV